MKKFLTDKLIVLLLLALPMLSLAQPVLTESGLPYIGNIFRMVQCDTTNVDPGMAGANITWDFSGLVLAGDTNSTFIVDPSTTLNSAFFPNSDYTARTADEYRYHSHDADGLYLDGVEFPQLGAVPFDSSATLLSFPFTYQDSQSNNYTANFQYIFFTAYRNGTVTAVADGHGTLILPNGTHTNALRVKTIEQSRDSASAAVTNDSYSTSYGWYVPGWRSPVLIISHFVSTGVLNSEVRLVEYLSTDTTNAALSPLLQSLDFKLAPNPAQGLTHAQLHLPKAQPLKLSLLDMQGRRQDFHYKQNQAQGHLNIPIDLEGLTPGLYLLQVQVGEQMSYAKMLVK